MTAPTLPWRRQTDVNVAPVPWPRMAWVIWRQHRFALSGVAALLGALAVCLWLLGLQLHRTYAAAASCHPASSLACGDLVGVFNRSDAFLATGFVLQAVPVLIGAFLGAPVLARELETGTFRYAWTQGFGRWRWTLAKLVTLGVVVATAAGALSLLFSWYYRPYFATGNEALGLNEWSPLAGGLFGLLGVAFAAWALAAFSIGTLAGMLTRRVLPAVAATVAAYTGLAFAAGLYLRKHYLAPLVTSNPATWASPGSAWVISQRWTLAGGRAVSQFLVARALQGAPPELAGKGGVPKALASVQYLNQHGYTLWTTYQPGSRFWSFQWIEGGWLVALSVLLMAITVWLVHRRAA